MHGIQVFTYIPSNNLIGAAAHTFFTHLKMSQQDSPQPLLWSPRRSYLFLAALVFIFVQAGLLAGHWSAEKYLPHPPTTTSQFPQPGPARLSGNVPEHPIPRLMDDAEHRFRALLSSQSRSLGAAVAEYKRRYGRNPPKGFDSWWRFAQANNVKMVDEYDGLVSDLEPFWEMTGEEFRMRAFQVCVFASFILALIRLLTRPPTRQLRTFLPSTWYAYEAARRRRSTSSRARTTTT